MCKQIFSQTDIINSASEKYCVSVLRQVKMPIKKETEWIEIHYS